VIKQFKKCIWKYMKEKIHFFLCSLSIIRSCKTVNIIVSLQMTNPILKGSDPDFVK